MTNGAASCLKYVKALSNWAWSLAELGRHEEAIEQIKNAFEIDPKAVWAYCIWGDTLSGLKRHEEAIEQYKKVIEIDPKHTTAYNSRGLAYS